MKRTWDGGQDPSEGENDANDRWLFDSFRRAAGRTCLGQPYTLIQNEVKRTLRGRTSHRVKEAQHECLQWVDFCPSTFYQMTGRF